MTGLDYDLVRNRVLAMMSATQYRVLQPDFEHVVLKADEVLYAPGDDVRYIYFPNDAVVSLLFNVDRNRTFEVAMEGNEAAVGFAVGLGDMNSSSLSIVREAGTATRIKSDAFADCIKHDGCLQILLDRYLYALLNQIAQISICNRFHNVDARLARWLLMTRDRVGSVKFHATQESIAHMLGVRRSSITAAASKLQKLNIINYRRGHIKIVDPVQLTTIACSCYQLIKQQYNLSWNL